VRALEGVVQYRPEAVRPPKEPRPPRQEGGEATGAPESAEVAAGGFPQAQPGEGSRRRRRRRRGRRGAGQGGPPQPGVDPNANTEMAGDIAEGQMHGDAALDSDAGEDDREIGEFTENGEDLPDLPDSSDLPENSDDGER